MADAQIGSEADRPAFCVFDTPLGACAIAWRAERIVALRLPESGSSPPRARLGHTGWRQREPGPVAKRAIEAVRALLNGERRDLTDIPCDLEQADAFERRVYEAVRSIPAGQTRTYGQVAAELGDKGLAQAVGQALGRNPLLVLVPCHRVVGAKGRLVGFSAAGGVALKRRMLAVEQASPWTAAAPDLFSMGQEPSAS